jgi:uncharacterized protein YcnI/copper(I)-binding protein
MMKLFSAAAVAALFCASSISAHAHATFERAEASPGAPYKGVLRVPHGCNGEATHTVRLKLPDELVSVKPMPKAGWTLTTKSAPYAQAYEEHGRKMSEGVREIVWSGGALQSDHFDEFVFMGRIAPHAKAPATIFAPVVQECANGQQRWDQVPAAGQSAHGLKAPAPAIRLVATAQPAASPAPRVYTLGSLKIERPWTRATPRSAPVAGGYLKVTNSGAVADRLIGGSFAHAGKVEVHEMSDEGGMMRMRQLTLGLEIPAGQTVELRPGGYHLMFMDLKQGIVAGQGVKGALVFEKAGRIEVEFDAAPLGASAPAAEHQHGHEHKH